MPNETPANRIFYEGRLPDTYLSTGDTHPASAEKVELRTQNRSGTALLLAKFMSNLSP